jgi:hypothetical protein
MKIRFRSGVLGAVVVFVAACDGEKMTEPTARPANVPFFSSTSTMDVPSTNIDGGGIPWAVHGEIPGRKWAMIRASGLITVSRNPELAGACDPNVSTPHDTKTAGPLGLASSYTQLRMGVRRGSTGLTLYLDPDSSSVKIKTPLFNWTTTPQPIEAYRSGISGLKGCLQPDGTTLYIAYYALSGSQKLTVDVLPDPEVYALETVVSSADTVTFIAQNSPSGVTPGWYFLGGDTLADPKGYYGTNYIGACAGVPACSTRVTVSGRMYLRLGYGTGLVYYPGPIVWVGKNPAEKLSVVCEPSFVNPNASTRCKAKSDGASIPAVSKWSFVSNTNVPTELAACGTATTCEAQIPASGKVYARATLSNVEQTASDKVTVVAGCPAGDSIWWSGCNTITPEQIDSIRESVKRQYRNPPVDSIADCETIYDKLDLYFEHRPIYQFDADIVRDNPFDNNYELGGHYEAATPEGWLLGFREFLFEPRRTQMAPILTPFVLDHDRLGRVAFHEAGHIAGKSEDDASYYEDQCLSAQ